jgi:glucose-6-phosphate 1-dehydrogenase
MSFDLVLFGGTGDLAWRKLLPSLFQAFRHCSMPEGCRIIGVARDDLSEPIPRADPVALPPGRVAVPAEEPERFAALLHYLRMDRSQPDDYQRLAATASGRPTPVMYPATAPSLFTATYSSLPQSA